MNKATCRLAMAMLTSLLATQALGSGYRVEVSVPSAAEETIGPGVKRAALIALGQVMTSQFERLYPPKRYQISIITGWESRADGLAHWSTCSVKRPFAVPVSGEQSGTEIRASAHGLLSDDDENYQPMAAVWASVLESCGNLVRRAVPAKSVAAKP